MNSTTTTTKRYEHIEVLDELAGLHQQCSELITAIRFMAMARLKHPDNAVYDRAYRILNAMYFKRTQILFFKS